MTLESLKRLPGWERRFVEMLSDFERRPFAWGGADCVGLAAAAVLAVAGRDLLTPWRGRYRTRRAAQTLCAARGFASPYAAVADALDQNGLVRCAPLLAGMGCVGLEVGGAACVRAPCGFIARDNYGAYTPATAVISWEYPN